MYQKTYAHEQNGMLAITTVLDPNMTIPSDWVEIDHSKLPSRNHRKIWILVDGEVKIDETRLAESSIENAKNERIEGLLKQAKLSEIADIILGQFDALNDAGKISVTPKMQKLLNYRNNQGE